MTSGQASTEDDGPQAAAHPGLPSEAAPQGMAQPLADLRSQLQAWRREGVWRADPLRFAHLEALARRTEAQSGALRQQLEARLAQGLAEFDRRVAQAREKLAEEAAGLVQAQPAWARPLRALQATGDVRGLARLKARAAPRCVPEPLQALQRQLQQASPTVRAAEPAEVAAGREELASVRAFRRVWGRRQSLDRLAQARARQPANAGPLNSHVLVLDALARLQALSPDYLRHLLAQVESLQWLERAREGLAAEAAKAPSKAAKAGKPAKPAKAAAPARARRSGASRG